MSQSPQVPVTQSIFKAYDIRCIVGKTVDAGVARSIGRAFGSEIRNQVQHVREQSAGCSRRQVLAAMYC